MNVELTTPNGDSAAGRFATLSCAKGTAMSRSEEIRAAAASKQRASSEAAKKP